MQRNDSKSSKGKSANQYTKLGCPRCSTLLIKKLMKKINHPSGAVLDVCGQCGGMWLDRNEVKMLYDYSGKKNRKK